MMSEQAAPVPHAGGTEGRHSAAPRTGISAAPVPGGTVPPGTALVRMSAAERAGKSLAHHARELWLNPGRLLYVLWNGKPESMGEHFAYMKSGAWVPEEIDGPLAKVLITAGLAFHLIVAWPLKAAAKSLDAAASRPLRFAFLAVLVIATLLILGIL